MNCYHCSKKITTKPWLHLFKTTDTYFCCGRCVTESNISGYWEYIVNKEDYKGIINPYMSNPYLVKKDKQFQLLTPNEIENLSVQERINYQNDYEEYFLINPERASEEYSQMIEELYIQEMEDEYYNSENDSIYSDDY